MTTITDYLQQNINGVVNVVSGSWVRLTNNATSTTYISTASSDSNGLYTVNSVPAGTYTVATGPSNTGPWTNTGDNNYTVEPTDSTNATTFPVGASVSATGEYLGTDYKATGVASLGNPQNTRYVGSWTTTGAPTGLTAAVADWGIDGNNAIWICTTAGSPGTWRTLPLGTLTSGYAQVTASQGNITTAVDLTSLTVTVTVGAGRRIKLSHYALYRSTVATDVMIITFQEGATVLGQLQLACDPASSDLSLGGATIITPSAGSHTYKMTAVRSGTGTGQMTAAATIPAYILAEDIGV